MTPQAKYNHIVRQDPLIRQIEAERQKERRVKPEYKLKAKLYWQNLMANPEYAAKTRAYWRSYKQQRKK